MSEHHSPGHSATLKEFLVSAELYISHVAAVALRKPGNTRKRSEKRETSIGQGDDNRRLKENSSWLALSKGHTGDGHWRSATCKLSEEGDRCLLNIYVDESILYQTVYVHLLNQTDIRQADRSLFFRKECLSIYCVGGQRWTKNDMTEPIYLQFSNLDLRNTWFALLRSYAIPEIYGRWFFPSDGGAYRMWRQVELTVASAKLFEPGTNGDAHDPDTADMGLYCAVHLNGILCGRTIIQKGKAPQGNAQKDGAQKGIALLEWPWLERFTFSDLPPFESLVLQVCREKKCLQGACLGSVKIPLGNFRRGETVEGWFPLLHRGSLVSDIQVGQIRLKIRVDEEIILPYSVYSGLLKTFNSRNFLDWISDFESKLKLKALSMDLLSVAVAQNVVIEHVQELASREVEVTPSSHQTLFRGNTTLTRIMELSMSWYGKEFLEASIGGVLRRFFAEKVTFDVEDRNGRSTKDLERNVDVWVYWCHEFWNQIYSVRAECPQEMRRLFETIRTLVENRYLSEPSDQALNRELPSQTVSAFCFLRFIVPAILNPHLFGFCPGLPSQPVHNSLKLIAKVIQSLANLNSRLQQEESVKDFLKESIPAMMDYISVVSAPTQDNTSNQGAIADRHDRLNVTNYLRQRSSNMTTLERETIPILPHMLDIPRHLAIITSAVIRNSRGFQTRPKPREDPADQPLDDFCSECFEIEEQALLRVSQLAKISSDRKPNSLPNQLLANTSPGLLVSSPLSGPSTRPTRRSPRPSTAPSPSESLSPHRGLLGDILATSSRGISLNTDPDTQFTRSRSIGSQRTHIKSPSTDSVPSLGLQSTRDLPPDTDAKKMLGLFKGILRKAPV